LNRYANRHDEPLGARLLPGTAVDQDHLLGVAARAAFAADEGREWAYDWRLSTCALYLVICFV
jgi:hypothetical protein